MLAARNSTAHHWMLLVQPRVRTPRTRREPAIGLARFGTSSGNMEDVQLSLSLALGTESLQVVGSPFWDARSVGTPGFASRVFSAAPSILELVFVVEHLYPEPVRDRFDVEFPFFFFDI
ncbi:hypothetical protein C7212DRAFT_366378 [Tuber magnatum]|uniref:Uncharacterized protein n=1 Tax=Tuber magnatum TaxID=42249 RepID=A0A317SFP7_9PEZI|nr:hypothetical protein C7212DRAFT_366378 [Tuber magnatum]